MKSENNSFTHIACPIHPSEVVQRVDMNPFAEKQLYCFDCLLVQKSLTQTPSNYQTIPDLIETAATFYSQNKKTIGTREQIPPEYLDLIGSQAEKLEQLSKHIEYEKKKMSNIFDGLMQDIVKIISEKKNKCLSELDQQLFNFKCWYLFFDKQIKRTFPMEEDISCLSPTKEDLMSKLEKITDANQLAGFVRDLKEDLNEDKLGVVRDLRDLSQELRDLDNIRPRYNEGDLEIQNLFLKFPDLEAPIGDIFRGPRLESTLLQGEDLFILREWIPKNLKFRLKLLYRGSRDGLSGPAFHQRCDGVKNTITLIKCKFKGALTSSIIGGYLDEAWVSNGSYIASHNSFIFSLTTKKRCPNSNSTYGGVGTFNYGPCFGGGYDIGILYHEGKSQCWVKPYSYSEATQIIDAQNYSGSGPLDFMLEDIEVFCL